MAMDRPTGLLDLINELSPENGDEAREKEGEETDGRAKGKGKGGTTPSHSYAKGHKPKRKLIINTGEGWDKNSRNGGGGRMMDGLCVMMPPITSLNIWTRKSNESLSKWRGVNQK
ncbi:hypothetical protein niasHT_015559 [Heterodera trifolii]|uniref:Uncharacterized protein n=1 Tax=Heterodera trifolii TaxID=157864 RepID=A0ABD2L072_9BILA